MNMNDTQETKKGDYSTSKGTTLIDGDLKNEDNNVTNNQPKKNIGKILSFVH